MTRYRSAFAIPSGFSFASRVADAARAGQAAEVRAGMDSAAAARPGAKTKTTLISQRRAA